MATKPDISDATVVSENGKKKWPTWFKWLLGIAIALFVIAAVALFTNVFSTIGRWIAVDPGYTWTIARIIAGGAIVFYFWDKAFKPKKSARGIATTDRPVIGKEFKYLSLEAFGVYAGILLCLWAILSLIIAPVFSFIEKYWIYSIAAGLIIGMMFMLDKKKHVIWGSIAILLIAITISEWSFISSTTGRIFGSSDTIAEANADSTVRQQPDPRDRVDQTTPPLTSDQPTTQPPVVEIPKTDPVETPQVTPPTTSIDDAIANDETIKQKKDKLDSVNTAQRKFDAEKVVKDSIAAVKAKLDREIAKAELKLAKAKKADLAGTKTGDAPFPNRRKPKGTTRPYVARNKPCDKKANGATGRQVVSLDGTIVTSNGSVHTGFKSKRPL